MFTACGIMHQRSCLLVTLSLLTISTDYSYVPTHTSKTVRKINKYTISDFIDKQSCESWSSTFNSEDVNAMFNCFLNI